MTLDDLLAWVRAHPSATGRLDVYGRRYVGHFTIPFDSFTDRIRLLWPTETSYRYAGITQEDLDEGRLEVKVGARYRPVAEVIPHTREHP